MPLRTMLFMIIVITAGLAPLQASDARQWPWWHGPDSDQSTRESSNDLAAEPRLAWQSTEFTKQVGGSISNSPYSLLGGCQSLVMHDNRIYVSYYAGSAQQVVLDALTDEEPAHKHVQRVKRKMASLARVGLTDWQTVKRLAFNIHADDVMVCLDAQTGRCLWRTAVPGGVHITKGTYGPHHTPAVDPSTGKVYALGSTGRILCFDGRSGELLWVNEDLPKLANWRDKKRWALQKRQCPYCLRSDYELLVAVDDLVLCAGTAIDGKTGKLLWQAGGAWDWLPWQHEGKWYVIDGGKRCFEVRSGKERWSLTRDEGHATSTTSLTFAINQNRMLCANACYRISPDGRELLWQNKDIKTAKMNGAIIADDKAWIVAQGPRGTGKKASVQLVQVDMSNGAISKRWPVGNFDFGVGNLMIRMGNHIYVRSKSNNAMWIDTKSDTASKVLDKSIAGLDGNIDSVQSAIGFQGRAYMRGAWSVLCLDFNKSELPPLPEPLADPACTELPKPLVDLGSPWQEDRLAAVSKLTKSNEHSHVLLELVQKGSYQTAQAATTVLLARTEQIQAPFANIITADTSAARLALILAIWSQHHSAEAQQWAEQIMQTPETATPTTLQKLGEALCYPVLSSNNALLIACRQALPQAIGAAADAATQLAWARCLELTDSKQLKLDGLLATLLDHYQANPDIPAALQYIMVLSLKHNQDQKLNDRAAALAVKDGKLTYTEIAMLSSCSTETLHKHFLPMLRKVSHFSPAWQGLIKACGPEAIPVLIEHHKRSSDPKPSKAAKAAAGLLTKLFGDAGQAALDEAANKE